MDIIKAYARLAVAAALFASSGAGAAVCHEQAGAGGANDGSNWASAYTNLQSALGNMACTETWVAAGAYKPGTARGNSFAIASGRAVHGGFAGNEAARTQADPLAHATILSGDIGAVEVASPHVCYVNHAASGAHDGLTWASAYVDLQSALLEPLCSEVWVAKGVYKPTTSGTDRGATFSIRPGVKVHGGFVGGETSTAQADPGMNRTVLSGDIDGDDTVDAAGITRTSSDAHGANSYGVVRMDATTAAGSIGADTVLDGFVISGGVGIPGQLNRPIGGGLYCNADASGRSCLPRLSRLWFAGNSADSGAALFNRGENGGTASPDLREVTFSGNFASQYGSAVCNYGYGGIASPSLENVTFSSNVASSMGGAMANQAQLGGQASPTLRSVTFAGNTGSGGAAMFVAATDTAVSATTIDGAILADPSGRPEINYYLSQGSVAISNSIVAAGCPGGQTTCQNVIAANPQLGTLQDNGGATPTLLPGPGSAATDAGAAATCGTTPYDFDQRGVARPQGAGCDLGAVEVRQTRLTVAVTGPGSVTADASMPAATASGIAACRADSGTCGAGYMAEPQPASALLDVAADTHAHLASVSDNCGVGGASAGALSGSTYALAAFAANCTVTATFAADTHAIGGSIGGLAGSGLQLQLDGGETVTPAPNATTFQFPTALSWGTHYDVAIAAQPTQPWQTCTLDNASGDVGDADVDDIAVTCTTNTYTVGGGVDGLAGGSVGVRLNGGETLTLSANAPFAFATALASGTDYSIDIAQQPDGQSCTVGHASGTVGGANVTDVVVHCAALPPHLALAIDGGSAFARYGRIVDYTITLSNDGHSPATGVPVDVTLSSAFDGQYAHWQCFDGGAGASCTASGDGPLHDSVTVPPGRSVTWHVSVPVLPGSAEAEATFMLAIGGAQPLEQTDTKTLVLLRDGFDVPYAGTLRLVGADAVALLGGDATRTFALPPPSGARIDDVLDACDASECVAVQRMPLAATNVLLRLMHRDAQGREHVSPWTAARSDATLAIGGMDGENGVRLILLEGGAAPLALPVIDRQ